MKKFIVIVITLAIVWTIWYVFGHVILGLKNVFSSVGLMIISGAIIGFILAPYDNPKKE